MKRNESIKRLQSIASLKLFESQSFGKMPQQPYALQLQPAQSSISVTGRSSHASQNKCKTRPQSPDRLQVQSLEMVKHLKSEQIKYMKNIENMFDPQDDDDMSSKKKSVIVSSLFKKRFPSQFPDDTTAKKQSDETEKQEEPKPQQKVQVQPINLERVKT